MIGKILKSLEEIKGKDYTITIPIENFDSIQNLISFFKTAENNEVCAILKYEKSNFYHGFLIEIFDKNYCDYTLINGEIVGGIL